MDRRLPILAASGLIALSAGACVSDTGSPRPAAGAQDPAETVRFGGRCRQINIGTPENPRFVPDPACGSGSDN